MSEPPSSGESGSRCPRCGAVLPDTGRFQVWCPACDWNIEAGGWLEYRQTALDRLVTKIRGRYAEKQFDELARRDPATLRPRLTPAKLATYAIAALVNFLPLVFLGSGIWIVVANWPRLWALIAGAVLAAIAFVVRPRRPKMPKDVLARSEAPRLYAFADRVAAASGAARVDAIVIDANYNASFQRLGWFGKSVLTIGLPLWTVLEPRERIALLSHEFAHGLNRDSLTHGFVGSAIGKALGLAALFKADTEDLIGLLFSPPYLLISGAFRWLARVMILLHWQQSQESEFLADHIATRSAGSEACVALLGKLNLGDYFRNVLDPISHSRDWRGQNFFPPFRALAASLPPLEVERARRLSERSGFDKAMTHPPRWARLRFAELHPSPPSCEATADEMRSIADELAKLEAPLTETLLAAYYPHH